MNFLIATFPFSVWGIFEGPAQFPIPNPDLQQWRIGQSLVAGGYWNEYEVVL